MSWPLRPTVERLNELFEYDNETGALRRKTIVRGARNGVGGVAGSVHKTGYVHLTVDRYRTLAHRVIWAICNNAWPELEIDHVNGNPSDNRIENLRCVTHAVNMKNITKPQRNNTTGYLGVTKPKDCKRYLAQISTGRKSRSIGYFDTPEQAHAAYKEAQSKAISDLVL